MPTALSKPHPRLRLRVTAAAESNLRSGHPWLFADSIREQNRKGELGELAVIYDRHNRFLAVGMYDPDSPIRLRVLQTGKPQSIDRGWWSARLEQAIARRKGLFDDQTTGYRWINGESDGWPGLVLDRYDKTLVLKLYTAAWLPRLDEIIALITDRLHPARLVLRLSRNIQSAAAKSNLSDGQILSWERAASTLSPDGQSGTDGDGRGLSRQLVAPKSDEGGSVLATADGNKRSSVSTPHSAFPAAPKSDVGGRAPHSQLLVCFLESSLRFEADVVRGQKTGFFLDQRENRRRVEALAQGRSVLNAFSFSGGFSLYAARGGATSVTDLDLSRHALDSSRRNFALNQSDARIASCPHELIQGDAFEWLSANGKSRFDLIILDPPSLAKREAERAGAIRAYTGLAQLGINHLNANGILVACSCSAHVTAEEFFAGVRSAATKSKRLFSELESTRHPHDHPATFKEAEYLKVIYVQISQ